MSEPTVATKAETSDARGRIAEGGVAPHRLFALQRSIGNQAVAAALQPPPAPGRAVLQRDPAPQVSGGPGEPNQSYTWQHDEARQRAEAVSALADAKPGKVARDLELYGSVVPAVVKAVSEGGLPLNSALLMINQGTMEHAPWDPKRLKEPVIPPGNMLWGITSTGKDPKTTVRTTTGEEAGGKVHKEKNRPFRSYDSMEDAARGYLLALEGSDPAAAKNPAFLNLARLLKDPNTTPAAYAAALKSAKFATASNYQEKFLEKLNGTKKTIRTLLPKIVEQQSVKLNDMHLRITAYEDVRTYISGEISRLAADRQSTPELDQLRQDLVTVNKVLADLAKTAKKQQQLIDQIKAFGAMIAPGQQK